MYTVSKLAKLFSLSRSTLLYYEKIDLLIPDEISGQNYRLYTEDNRKELEKICLYRDMGIPLKKIRQMLIKENDHIQKELENQLLCLNKKIQILRKQQQAILNILQQEPLMKSTRLLSKDQWVQMFKNAGMSEQDMHNWHRDFEANAPEAHQDFLESIGLDEAKIRQIRQWAGGL